MGGRQNEEERRVMNMHGVADKMGGGAGEGRLAVNESTPQIQNEGRG
jgi:hypothetical protein